MHAASERENLFALLWICVSASFISYNTLLSGNRLLVPPTLKYEELQIGKKKQLLPSGTLIRAVHRFRLLVSSLTVWNYVLLLLLLLPSEEVNVI